MPETMPLMRRSKEKIITLHPGFECAGSPAAWLGQNPGRPGLPPSGDRSIVGLLPHQGLAERTGRVRRWSETMARTTRRQFALLAAAGAAGAFMPHVLAQNAAPLITRAIPKSGEQLPAVGLGTAYVFDDDSATTRGKAEAVIKALAANGGTLIDTASTYGDAERVIGAVLGPAGGPAEIFRRHQARIARCGRAAPLAGALADAKGRSPAAAQCQQPAAIAGALCRMEGAGRVPLRRDHVDLSWRLPRG